MLKLISFLRTDFEVSLTFNQELIVRNVNQSERIDDLKLCWMVEGTLRKGPASGITVPLVYPLLLLSSATVFKYDPLRFFHRF